MATYIFAETGAPVRDHMTALLQGLKQWERDCTRRLDQATTQKDQNYWRGKRDGFRETIDVIENSNSMETDDQQDDEPTCSVCDAECSGHA